jgi:hypothetical protein
MQKFLGNCKHFTVSLIKTETGEYVRSYKETESFYNIKMQISILKYIINFDFTVNFNFNV